MLSPILTLSACISKPLWLNIRSTGAEVTGGQFHASWVTKTESSWSQVPRPRLRPRLEGSKTKTETETRGFQDQDQDQDSEVPRPRPRPRLVKTGLETSRDQDSSLENSKSGYRRHSCISKTAKIHCFIIFVMYCIITTCSVECYRHCGDETVHYKSNEMGNFCGFTCATTSPITIFVFYIYTYTTRLLEPCLQQACTISKFLKQWLCKISEVKMLWNSENFFVPTNDSSTFDHC